MNMNNLMLDYHSAASTNASKLHICVKMLEDLNYKTLSYGKTGHLFHLHFEQRNLSYIKTINAKTILK